MDGKKRIARLRNAEKRKKNMVPGLGKAFKAIRKAKKAGEIVPIAVGICIGKCRLDETWMRDSDGEYIRVPRGKTPFTNSRMFQDRLIERGYKILGSGAYSTVLAKGEAKRVIKIQHNYDNWIDYCKWAAEKGYAGSFAPQVYSYKRYTNFAVAVMERMDRTTNDDKDDLALIDRLIGPASHGNMMAKLFMEELSPKCTTFFDDLFRDFSDHLDLYGKNIMIRKDGSLCVTDPVCGRSKLTSVKRLRSGDLSPSISEYYEIYRNCNSIRANTIYGVCS